MKNHSIYNFPNGTLLQRARQRDTNLMNRDKNSIRFLNINDGCDRNALVVTQKDVSLNVTVSKNFFENPKKHQKYRRCGAFTKKHSLKQH